MGFDVNDTSNSTDRAANPQTQPPAASAAAPSIIYRVAGPRIALRSRASAALTDEEKADRATLAQTAPWNLPPPDRELFRPTAFINVPAFNDGIFHVIVQQIVPKGRNGVLKLLANEIFGGGFTDGNIIWQVVRNPANGIATAEFNFDNIQSSLGTLQVPALLDPGIRIFENDVIQLVATNVGINQPAGQVLRGLLGGYFYPAAYDEGH